MNEFQEPKSEYEHIPIPAELSNRVQEGLRQGGPGPAGAGPGPSAPWPPALPSWWER